MKSTDDALSDDSLHTCVGAKQAATKEDDDDAVYENSVLSPEHGGNNPASTKKL